MDWSTSIKVRTSVYMLHFLVYWSFALVFCNVVSFSQVYSFNYDLFFQLFITTLLILLPVIVYVRRSEIGKVVLLEKGVKIYNNDNITVFKSTYENLEVSCDVETTKHFFADWFHHFRKSSIKLINRDTHYEISSDQLNEYIFLEKLKERNVKVEEKTEFSSSFYWAINLIAVVTMFFAAWLFKFFYVGNAASFNIVN